MCVTRPGGLRLSVRHLVPDGMLLPMACGVSVPAGVDSTSTMAGQLVFCAIVNRLGARRQRCARHRLTWEALGYLSGVHAFGTGGMTLDWPEPGARKPERADPQRLGRTRPGLPALCLCDGTVFLHTGLADVRPFFARSGTAAGGRCRRAGLRLIAFSNGRQGQAGHHLQTSVPSGAGDTRVPVWFTWIGSWRSAFRGVHLTQPRLDLGPFGTIQWRRRALGLYGPPAGDVGRPLVVRVSSFFCVASGSGRWKQCPSIGYPVPERLHRGGCSLGHIEVVAARATIPSHPRFPS